MKRTEADIRASFHSSRGGKGTCGISRGVCPPPTFNVGGARRAVGYSPVRVGSAAASHGTLSWNTSLLAEPSAARYPAVGPCVLASPGGLHASYSTVTPMRLTQELTQGYVRDSFKQEARGRAAIFGPQDCFSLKNSRNDDLNLGTHRHNEKFCEHLSDLFLPPKNVKRSTRYSSGTAPSSPGARSTSWAVNFPFAPRRLTASATFLKASHRTNESQPRMS